MEPLDKLTPFDALKRISELPGGKKDPFADPYGPSSSCFSSNDITRMYQLGPTFAERLHLLACTTCKQRSDSFAKVSPVQSPPPRKWYEALIPQHVFSLHEEKAVRVQKALVFSPQTCVVDGTGVVKSIPIEILTDFKPEIQGAKVTLTGPLIGTVVPAWIGKNAFEIHNVKVSPAVVTVLREHSGHIEPLNITFGTSANAPLLVATTNLEFSKLSE